MTPVPCVVHQGRTPAAASRLMAENGGWSESTCLMRSQRSNSSMSKLETPACRTLPSSTSRPSSPQDSSIGRARDVVRMMELIQVNRLDAQTAKRCFALLPDRLGAQVPAGKRHSVRPRPAFSALREDQRSIRGGDPGERASHHLLRVAVAVDGGSVDPVDAERHSMPERGDRCRVILGTPRERPAASAHRPSTSAHRSDIEARPPEPAP